MPRRQTRTPPTRATLERLRADGLTRDEIAAKLGVPLSTVKKWIKELQVSPLPQGVVPRKKKPKKPPRLEDGFTVVDIAKFYLGKRMSEDWRGYLLDGKPCKLSDLLAEAQKLGMERNPE